MIERKFLGSLKKYENVRIENEIYIKVLIKHVDEGSTQTFLNSFADKLKIDNVESLFAFPVRWKKIVIDVSDFVLKSYKVKFGELEFPANLEEITVNHKFQDGNETFEYSLSFIKETDKGTLDQLMAEAYLNYKEETDDGKKVIAQFEVELELLEDIKQTTVEETINNIF